jgi:hypothetical protein
LATRIKPDMISMKTIPLFQPWRRKYTHENV